MNKFLKESKTIIFYTLIISIFIISLHIITSFIFDSKQYETMRQDLEKNQRAFVYIEHQTLSNTINQTLENVTFLNHYMQFYLENKVTKDRTEKLIQVILERYGVYPKFTFTDIEGNELLKVTYNNKVATVHSESLLSSIKMKLITILL